MRWVEDDGHVSVFRFRSNNSNGNTFDFQGRQLSCEHLTRRVVRYEHDGTVTVIIRTAATDSPIRPIGGQLYEGEPDVAGGPSNAAGKRNPRIGQPAGFVPGRCGNVCFGGRKPQAQSPVHGGESVALCGLSRHARRRARMRRAARSV
jgi:hypothetical protein